LLGPAGGEQPELEREVRLKPQSITIPLLTNKEFLWLDNQQIKDFVPTAKEI
jgi:hypothetical protein